MKKRRQFFALLLCLVMTFSFFTGYSEVKAAAETREITDMAGRKVTVPAAENIESVFSGHVHTTLLYFLRYFSSHVNIK